MDVSKLVGEIFSLVNIPLYNVRGVVEGENLLVTALREGAANLYVLRDGSLVKLNKEPISGVAEPPYGSRRVVIYRDVAKGRELMALYTVRVDNPGVEEPLSQGLKPMRLLSVVDKGDRVYVTGVGEQGIGIYEALPGGDARFIAPVPGLGALTDVHDGLGAGILFQPTGRINMFLVNIESGETWIEQPDGSVMAAEFREDGKIVVGLERSDRADLLLYDPQSRSFEPLTLPHPDFHEASPTAITYLSILPGGELLVVTRKHGRGQVFLDGKRLEGPEGIYATGYKWRGGLAILHTSLHTPYRIIHLREDGWEPILEPEVPEPVREALGEKGFHWVESFDGEKVPVFTLESRRAGKPGPTVVLVHGGPFSEDLDAWSVFATALALTGYHVVMPNYRGSTGYGEEWRNKILGDPCGAELEDIVAAARWAKESGLASRLIIMGYSYGGYATMCAMTRKPGVFEAGVAGASVVDWEEMYELSDAAFKQFIELVFAGDRSKWRERSPIEYVDNLQGPLCIIHPQNDTRTPLRPVLRFMEKALEKGKTFEAHIAPDMGHAINTVDDVIKILLPAVLFLHRLKQEEKNK